MAIHNVALLGADGKLGPSILKALIASKFNVTVLKRTSSKSKSSYPQERKISDDFPVPDLVDALRGNDAVVVTIKGDETALQKRMADACIQAGVKRFIPADFGSCDSSSPRTQELVPLYSAKTEMREYLTSLARAHPDFTWTSIVCGHFFDWSAAFLHIWIDRKRIDVLDDGETRWSASTLSRIGEATARTLLRPEVTANRMIYVQSFCVTQNQVLGALQRATGSPWEVRRFDSTQFLDEQRKKADVGDVEAVEEVVWYLGTVDANWESREGFAMKDLGLADEDLDLTLQRMVKESAA